MNTSQIRSEIKQIDADLHRIEREQDELLRRLDTDRTGESATALQRLTSQRYTLSLRRDKLRQELREAEQRREQMIAARPGLVARIQALTPLEGALERLQDVTSELLARGNFGWSAEDDLQRASRLARGKLSELRQSQASLAQIDAALND